jgi:hypothetical protein
MRVNRGQEFVIGGYTVGTTPFDALIFGYYEDDRLIYAARTRNGFTPVVRETPVQEVPRAGNHELPVRQSSGGEERSMGRGSDSGEDEGLSVAEAGFGSADRVPRMDRRKSPAAHQIRCAAMTSRHAKFGESSNPAMYPKTRSNISA